MPFPIAVPIIMAAAGALKGMTIDRAKEDRQRKLAAETARYSPWTGMAPGQVQEADPFGSAMQFGMAGAGLGQNIQSMNASQAFQDKFGANLDAQTALLNRGAQVPWQSTMQPSRASLGNSYDFGYSGWTPRT